MNSGATFGELAWNGGQGHARDGASWPRRLWFRELSRDAPLVKPGPRAEDWPSGQDAARTAPTCPDPIAEKVVRPLNISGRNTHDARDPGNCGQIVSAVIHCGVAG